MCRAGFNGKLVFTNKSRQYDNENVRRIT